MTALSLHSTSLSGILLLVDTRLNSFTGIKHTFARLCEQSTDFHFPDLDRQLQILQEDLKLAEEKERAVAEQQPLVPAPKTPGRRDSKRPPTKAPGADLAVGSSIGKVVVGDLLPSFC